MDAFLLTVKSFTENLFKSDCFCNSNYYHYKEGAKLCLCENEYRKLKAYVDHFKFLECQESIKNDLLNLIGKSKEKDIRPTADVKETQRAIAMLIITQIEDKLEFLNSGKIITKVSDPSIGQAPFIGHLVEKSIYFHNKYVLIHK